jgi:hypothetical protein
MLGGPQAGTDHYDDQQHCGAQHDQQLTLVQRPDDLGRKTGCDQAWQFQRVLDCRQPVDYSDVVADSGANPKESSSGRYM